MITKETKNRFKLWLNQCLSFEDFKKKYDKMIGVMNPKYLKPLDNWEQDERGLIVGSNWQITYAGDSVEPEVILNLQTGGLRYKLKLINRKLGEMGTRLTPPDPTRLDFDSVAVLEIENLKTHQQLINEVIVMRSKENNKLIFRELVGTGYQYKQRNVQVKELATEHATALLER